MICTERKLQQQARKHLSKPKRRGAKIKNKLAWREISTRKENNCNLNN